jgi:hypothetical protein
MRGFWLSCSLSFSIAVVVLSVLCHSVRGEESIPPRICKFWTPPRGGFICMDTDPVFDCFPWQMCKFKDINNPSEQNCDCANIW